MRKVTEKQMQLGEVDIANIKFSALASWKNLPATHDFLSSRMFFELDHENENSNFQQNRGFSFGH